MTPRSENRDAKQGILVELIQRQVNQRNNMAGKGVKKQLSNLFPKQNQTGDFTPAHHWVRQRCSDLAQ